MTALLAYIDPASGSAILQAIVAALAGAAVAMKVYWARIKNFFSRSSDDATQGPEPESKG
jgi:hypothetical protein